MRESASRRSHGLLPREGLRGDRTGQPFLLPLFSPQEAGISGQERRRGPDCCPDSFARPAGERGGRELTLRKQQHEDRYGQGCQVC